MMQRFECKAIMITCSDFRFKTVERELPESLQLRDDYDLIARPGAARSLVAPRHAAAAETMIEEIGMLLTLHSFTRCILVNHMSCGAYQDLTRNEDERTLHRSHLLAAAANVERRWQGVTAECYLLDMDPATGRIQPVRIT